ncbi:hypothetical protein [Zestomonas thermotolerans]|uniref:hypothetical protein n=1 Tax=Zestomonas thermotolerans TaxID=157784 RepID=UPI0012DD6D53|nr:hypothetical protein [Pseudomonas thermotolerans]
MKKEVFTQPLQFSQEELTKRKEKAKDRILNGYYNNRDWVYPAVNHMVFNSYDEVLKAVAEQTKAGNELFTGHILRMPIPGFFEVYFYKPKAEIDAILKAELERVEESYNAEIEADKKAKTELLANQLFEQARAKAKKQAEDKERKEKEQALKEAEEYVASLMKGTKN